MIPDVLIFIITLLASGVVQLLKLIPFLTPDSWQTAITNMFGYFGYFQGWLPIYPDPTQTGLWASVGLMTIVGWFITALVAVYLMKGAVMIIHLFSFGKIGLRLPSFGKGRTLKE